MQLNNSLANIFQFGYYRTISHSDRSAVATEKAPKTVHPLSNKKSQAVEMDDSFVGMSGGEIFHEMMLRHDVKHVFGYPGGAILPVFDAIHESEYFKFILPRHEQGAGHMAEGYAKATYVDLPFFFIHVI